MMGDEDLVQRCEECDFCVFEHVLKPCQRKRILLDKPLPKNHVHWEMIEQICGRHHDSPCEMKYVVMRLNYGDFMIAQLGAINTLIWDLEKREDSPNDYAGAMMYWAQKRDMGGDKEESYAKRFREIWNKGLRKNEGVDETKQILTMGGMYEMVVAPSETYNHAIVLLDKLAEESKARGSGALII